MSNLTVRILTALVGAPLLVGLLYLGGWWFGALVVVLAFGAQLEVYAMLRAGGLHAQQAAGLLVGVGLALRPLLPEAAVAAVGVFLTFIALSPFVREEGAALPNLAATVLGAVYPAFLFGFLLDLRLMPSLSEEEGFWLTLSVFLLIWATDTLAYFSGRAFGKHPLAPSISPKKTWEGAVGGALGALGVAALLKVSVLGFLAWPVVVGVGLICGVVSQLGDLAESKLKRSVGVKDSGAILPGHGGLLDRFDSLLLAAPLVYLYLVYVS